MHFGKSAKKAGEVDPSSNPQKSSGCPESHAIWHRLFGRVQKKPAAPSTKANNPTPEDKPKKKKSCWRRFLSCFKKKDRDAPKADVIRPTTPTPPTPPTTPTPSRDNPVAEKVPKRKKRRKVTRPTPRQVDTPLLKQLYPQRSSGSNGKAVPSRSRSPGSKGKAVPSRSRSPGSKGKAEPSRSRSPGSKGKAEPSLSCSPEPPKGKAEPLLQRSAEPKGKAEPFQRRSPEPKGKAEPLLPRSSEPKGKAEPFQRRSPEPKGKAEPLLPRSSEPKGKAEPLLPRSSEPKGKAEPLQRRSPEPKGKAEPFQRRSPEPKGKAEPLLPRSSEPKGKAEPLLPRSSEPKGKAEPFQRRSPEPKGKAEPFQRRSPEPKGKAEPLLPCSSEPKRKGFPFLWGSPKPKGKAGQQSKSTKGGRVVGRPAGGSLTIYYGLPNLGQSCYMNSALQSLLTLEDFMGDISRMENIWNLVPKAQIINRRLMAVRDSRTSSDSRAKTTALERFKAAVATHAPTFKDNQQKDAHEFLNTVLDQIRGLAPLLKRTAANMARAYKCPIEDHMVFKMENTRTCKSCGSQSFREEEFTSLCLDLVPGGCVEEMLQNTLKKTPLDFKCVCGGKKSELQTSFTTLPRVLILHLKRFRFTRFSLEKANDAVKLLRDIIVPSDQGGGCYSLVSTINHLGGLRAGHYFTESVHPDATLHEAADRWLKLNDSAVTETTGWSVCEKRKRDAYILFYKRQD